MKPVDYDQRLSLLDVGCGTGRLTPTLAEAFGGPAVGVEPSRKMLQQAVCSRADPASPARSRSFD